MVSAMTSVSTSMATKISLPATMMPSVKVPMSAMRMPPLDMPKIAEKDIASDDRAIPVIVTVAWISVITSPPVIVTAAVANTTMMRCYHAPTERQRSNDSQNHNPSFRIHLHPPVYALARLTALYGDQHESKLNEISRNSGMLVLPAISSAILREHLWKTA